MFNFWWLAERSEQKMLTKMQKKKKWKRPPKSLKNKMFIFGLRSTFDDWLSKKCWPKHKKKQKRPPKSSKNKMLIFGLRSTSDDRPSDPSIKRDRNAKNWKRPLKSLKNKMFLHYVQILMISRAIWAKMLSEMQRNEKGPLSHWKLKCSFLDIHSTSDDRLSDLNRKHWPKCKKWKGPLSHWKIKCSFLDYVQLLMIGRAIQAKNVHQNTRKHKRPPKSSKNKMFVFQLRSTSDDRPSDPSKKHWPKHKKLKKAP